MSMLIDAYSLCVYANNTKDKTISANDIMRFPTVDAIPFSFIETRISTLAKERNKYEICTQEFRNVDMQIYYYEMLMEEWKPTLTEWGKEN